MGSSGFTSSQIIEEVTEIEMDEIKGNTRLKGYQILESYTLNFLKGLQIYRTKK